MKLIRGYRYQWILTNISQAPKCIYHHFNLVQHVVCWDKISTEDMVILPYRFTQKLLFLVINFHLTMRQLLHKKSSPNNLWLSIPQDTNRHSSRSSSNLPFLSHDLFFRLTTLTTTTTTTTAPLVISTSKGHFTHEPRAMTMRL